MATGETRNFSAKDLAKLSRARSSPIVVFDERGAGNVRVEALDLDEGVVDRFGKAEEPAACGLEYFVPGGEDRLRGISKHEA